MSSTVYFADTSGAQVASIVQTFTVAGTPTVPTGATLTVTDPLSVVTVYTFTGVTGGIFTVSGTTVTAKVPITSDGMWAYSWVVTASASTFDAAVVAGSFDAFVELESMWYCSPAELKDRLGITATNDDSLIARACQMAAADVEQFTGRFFYQQSRVQTYRNENIYDLDIDDVVSITQFATSTAGMGTFDTIWTSSQYQLGVSFHKYNQFSKGEQWPFTYLQALGVPGGLYLPYVWAWSRQDRCQVTGVFGWPKIPANVREAALLLAVDHYKRKDSPFGIAGFSEYGPVRIAANSMVGNLLHRYVKTEVKVGI